MFRSYIFDPTHSSIIQCHITEEISQIVIYFYIRSASKGTKVVLLEMGILIVFYLLLFLFGTFVFLFGLCLSTVELM